MSENYRSHPAAPPTTNAPLPNSLYQRTSDVAARLQNLSNLLRSDRERNIESRRAMDALDRDMQEMSADPHNPHRGSPGRGDRRRRAVDYPTHDSERDVIIPGPDIPQSPSSLLRARHRATRPSERLQRHRDRLNQPAVARQDSGPPRAPTSYSPDPRIGSPDIAAREYSGEAAVNRENRWRAKRRKLDEEESNASLQGFKYGHKGQVVPGKLKMEMVSCDGGSYSEPNGDSSWALNVLDDDPTVYCTKGNRCNIVLAHPGNMPFSLTKIVVKAPRTDFDAPIQEGLIFVAMENDHLLTRTADYQIQYAPHKYRHRSRRSEYSQISLAPSHEYFASVRSPLRSLNRLEADSFDRQPQTVAETIDRYVPQPPHVRNTLMTADFTQHASASEMPAQIEGFRVTMNYDDLSDNEDGLPASDAHRSHDPDVIDIERLLGLQDYYRPNYLSNPYDENDHDHSDYSSLDNSSGEDGERAGMFYPDTGRSYANLPHAERNAAAQRIAADDYIRGYRRESWFERWRQRRLDEGGFPPGRRERPSRIEVGQYAAQNDAPNSGETNVAAEATAPTTTAQTPDLLAPHARFFILRDKSSVSIKFDPPVAGKYILIKLWAPCPSANIDIQSILVHGYAGPRFFPAIEYR